MTVFVPVPLQTWATSNVPDENMNYHRAYWPQIMFVQDTIPGLLSRNYQEYKKVSGDILVINTHTSKSILLPVMEITLSSGVKFLLRDNFYDWKVSVESPKPLKVDFQNLIQADRILDVYCEGFPKDRVHPAYSQNHSKFTAELPNGYRLYVFFWLIGNALGLGQKD